MLHRGLASAILRFPYLANRTAPPNRLQGRGQSLSLRVQPLRKVARQHCKASRLAILRDAYGVFLYDTEASFLRRSQARRTKTLSRKLAAQLRKPVNLRNQPQFPQNYERRSLASLCEPIAVLRSVSTPRGHKPTDIEEDIQTPYLIAHLLCATVVVVLFTFCTLRIFAFTISIQTSNVKHTLVCLQSISTI